MYHIEIVFLQAKLPSFDAGRRWLACFRLKDVFEGFVVGF